MNFEKMTSNEIAAYYLLNPIDVTKVTSVYSGRLGCACGCRGKYTYASKTRAKESERRGYPIKDEEVNDRVVKSLVTKFQRLVNSSDHDGLDFMARNDWVNVEKSNRSYTIYFRNYKGKK